MSPSLHDTLQLHSLHDMLQLHVLHDTLQMHSSALQTGEVIMPALQLKCRSCLACASEQVPLPRTLQSAPIRLSCPEVTNCTSRSCGPSTSVAMLPLLENSVGPLHLACQTGRMSTTETCCE